MVIKKFQQSEHQWVSYVQKRIVLEYFSMKSHLIIKLPVIISCLIFVWDQSGTFGYLRSFALFSIERTHYNDMASYFWKIQNGRKAGINLSANNRCPNFISQLSHLRLCAQKVAPSKWKKFLPQESCTSRSHSRCPHRDGTCPVSRSSAGSPAWTLARTTWRFKVKENSNVEQEKQQAIKSKEKLYYISWLSPHMANMCVCTSTALMYLNLSWSNTCKFQPNRCCVGCNVLNVLVVKI